jgi:hypothetical protein
MVINKSSFQWLSDKSCNKKHIKSISEFQKYIDFLGNKIEDEELWYRGVSNASYELIPSIYRDCIWRYNPENEKDITYSFIHRAKGYINNSSTIRKWEWYQIMQHHGLPTRLLDWTEGYLIALYFSVRHNNGKNIPAVWVINPYNLNLMSSDKSVIYYTDSTTRDSNDEIVDNYLFDSPLLPEFPIAMVPPYVNVRMSSQKSCFTVHGKIVNGFRDIFNKNKNIQLVQLTIDPSKAESIKYELFKMGITEVSLFPDLEGLSRELRYRYKMQV